MPKAIAVEDQATGCVENPHGLGKIYDTTGTELNGDDIAVEFEGKGIEIPNAGASSYNKLLTSLGYKKVEVVDWSSSAGDWTFGAFDGESWYVVSQSNRYPYHGFRYSINRDEPFDSFEQLCNFATA